MPFALRQASDVKRRMVASRLLEKLGIRIDLRVLYDVVVVSAALLIGALLCLALARPLPASPNRAFEPRNCIFLEHAGNPCAHVNPLQ